jgi:dipeptidyl aminopeptidase/acylaminoacyl peptidase
VVRYPSPDREWLTQRSVAGDKDPGGQSVGNSQGFARRDGKVGITMPLRLRQRTVMPKRPIALEDLASIRTVGDPQISPDGMRVLYTVKVADVGRNRYFSHLWLCDIHRPRSRGGPVRARQFTFGDVSDASPRWRPATPAGSADGGEIAFIRTAQKKTQIWLMAAQGGEPRALTALPEGSIGELSWSPDGRSLAFTYRPTHEDRTREAAERREASGKSSPPRVITSVLYRFEGQGFQDERQHIWVCDVDSGTARAVTHGDFDDNDPAWSPDGQTIAFTSNRVREPARHDYRTDIWLAATSGRAPARRIPTPVSPKRALAWSPDGDSIAYVGHEVGADPWLPLNSFLWVVPRVHGSSAAARRGGARCLSGVLDRGVGDETLGDARGEGSALPIWSADGTRVFFVLSDSGSSHLYRADVKTARLTRVLGGRRTICGVTADAARRRLALLIGTATAPAEVHTAEIPGGRTAAVSPRALTNHNGAWLAGVQVGAPREFWITRPDGKRVQGWMLHPPGFTATKKYPCLLYVHGGPRAQYGETFFHELQYHAARGYLVAYANPRGSGGRDSPFGACIHRDWGRVDFDDVMAVADHAASLPYVDAGRMAIAGGSYGGFMTNWVVGHTRRFRCAVTDRSISNFVSMVGTSDAPPPPGGDWPGVPIGDDMEKGWNMSPLKYVENVRTPVLIIHSEGDLRCPITQAEEWFTALRWLKQEVVLVRYPPETNHGLSREGPIDLRCDRLMRIGAWLDRHCR